MGEDSCHGMSVEVRDNRATSASPDTELELSYSASVNLSYGLFSARQFSVYCGCDLGKGDANTCGGQRPILGGIARTSFSLSDMTSHWNLTKQVRLAGGAAPDICLSLCLYIPWDFKCKSTHFSHGC